MQITRPSVKAVSIFHLFFFFFESYSASGVTPEYENLVLAITSRSEQNALRILQTPTLREKIDFEERIDGKTLLGNSIEQNLIQVSQALIHHGACLSTYSRFEDRDQLPLFIANALSQLEIEKLILRALKPSDVLIHLGYSSDQRKDDSEITLQHIFPKSREEPILNTLLSSEANNTQTKRRFSWDEKNISNQRSTVLQKFQKKIRRIQKGTIQDHTIEPFLYYPELPTRELWITVMQDTPQNVSNREVQSWMACGNCPLDSMTYKEIDGKSGEIQLFLAKLTRLLGKADTPYALPTELQTRYLLREESHFLDNYFNISDFWIISSHPSRRHSVRTSLGPEASGRETPMQFGESLRDTGFLIIQNLEAPAP